MNIVIDAGVILKGYFPDEEGHEEAQRIIREYAEGLVEISAPYLILYEITNALCVAKSRGRLEQKFIQTIIEEIKGIEIKMFDVSDIRELFDMSLKYGRGAYDSGYLLLAKAMNANFITGDMRLYNVLRGKLPWVVWIGNYKKIP